MGYNYITMSTTIQLRRDTSSNWTLNNPALSQGEIGIETDTNKIKIGNGTSAWSSLSYFGAEVDLSAYLTSTSPQTIVPAVTSNYTLNLTDSNCFIPLNSSSAFTITVPTDNSVNFPVGTRIDMVQLGTGQVTVSGETSGAQTSLVRSTPGAKFRAQYSGAGLVKISTNLWSLVGDLSA
jgi:hypothetical protein